MTKEMAKILSVASIACVLASSSAYAANPASLTLASSASSVVNGSTFSVSAYENGDNVNVVTIRLSYDSTKLQFLGSTCGSALPNTMGESDGITCYANGGSSASGNNLIANISFKAISDSGSTIISIAGGSKIAANGVNIWDQANNTTSVSLSAPVSTPAPEPVIVNQGSSVDTGVNSSASAANNAADNASGEDASADDGNKPLLGATDVAKTSSVQPQANENVSNNKADNHKFLYISSGILLTAAAVLFAVYYFFGSKIMKFTKKFAKISKNNINKNYRPKKKAQK